MAPSKGATPTTGHSALDAAPRATCAHCSLPVPPGEIDLSQDKQFCCNGCRGAYALINSLGLDSYYSMREQMLEDSRRTAARPTADEYEQYDTDAYRDLYCRRIDDTTLETELVLEGLHCAACIWLLERLPQMLDGVAEARVDYQRSTIHLRWDESRTTLGAIARHLDRLGYPSHPATDLSRRRARRTEDRRYLVRIGVAGACAGNVMLIAFALYGGMFSAMAAEHAMLFRWASFILAAVSLAWPGSEFFRNALTSLRNRVLSMDLPIALGLGAGAASGLLNTITNTGEVYFDTVTALVFLLLLGRWVQHRQQRSSADAVEMLFSLTPSTARLVEGDRTTRLVPIEALETGALIEVRPGETLPADAILLSEHASLDLSLLTGESLPATMTRGSEVPAGAVNLSTTLRARVTAAGRDSRVARLMQLVESASARKPRVVRLADRIAGWFVAAVICLAGATALLWALLDPAQIVGNTTALLIVTCPCALGLATPLAVVAAIGRAARAGLLIKGGDALEALAKPGVIYLDKTGTLTEGTLRLEHWDGPDDVKPLIVAAESHAAHPVARAFRDAFGPTDLAPDHAEHTIGAGVIARVDGRRITVGTRRFVEEVGCHVPARIDESHNAVLARSLSPVLVAIDGEAVGVAGFGDPIRLDARAVIDDLKRRGWTVGLISGDSRAVVASVAERLGIDPARVHANVTPEGKVRIIESHDPSERIVMVGDGVNDAAALSLATVGIAVHGGAEASLEAADVYISSPGVTGITKVLDGARRTLRVIRVNLAVSLCYNAVCATLAISGLINPLIAAILMPLSSLTVITISFRAPTFRRAEP